MSASHPVFARVYRRLAAAAERGGADEHRRSLLAGLSGSVVEVGAGAGTNFGYYPAGVTHVLAVEPEPYLRRAAAWEASAAAVPVEVVAGTADALPCADRSMDAGVCSLVLCSVPDPLVALRELHRVIRPGGELRFYEHVRSDDSRVAIWQDRVDPVWTRLAGGCHANRDTAGAIRAAGFEVESVEEIAFPPGRMGLLTGRHLLGVARR